VERGLGLVLQGQGIGDGPGVVVQVSAGAEISTGAARQQDRRVLRHVARRIRKLRGVEQQAVVQQGAIPLGEVGIGQPRQDLRDQAGAPPTVVGDLGQPIVELCGVGAGLSDLPSVVTQGVADVEGRVHAQARRSPGREDVGDLQVGHVGQATTEGRHDQLSVERPDQLGLVGVGGLARRRADRRQFHALERLFQGPQVFQVGVHHLSVGAAHPPAKATITFEDPVQDAGPSLLFADEGWIWPAGGDPGEDGVEGPARVLFAAHRLAGGPCVGRAVVVASDLEVDPIEAHRLGRRQAFGDHVIDGGSEGHRVIAGLDIGAGQHRDVGGPVATGAVLVLADAGHVVDALEHQQLVAERLERLVDGAQHQVFAGVRGAPPVVAVVAAMPVVLAGAPLVADHAAVGEHRQKTLESGSPAAKAWPWVNSNKGRPMVAAPNPRKKARRPLFFSSSYITRLR
jgi:hypothetical protein